MDDKQEADGPRGAARGAERAPPAEPAVPRLSRGQFWFCLAAAVVAFLFCTGPVWEHPWDLDRAILYSYLPLPLLVLGLLAWSRRLTLRGFLLDTLTLTLLKYGITLSIALVLWSTGGQPPKPAALHPFAAQAAPPEAAPAPTPIPPETTGALHGNVVGAEGQPLGGVLVFIEEGLERYVFSAPTVAVQLENDGAGVTPRLSAAQALQPISARSTDGRLHTLVAESAGGPLFNVPLLSGGLPSTTAVREAHGISRIRCAVHQGDIERASYIGVFAHPFFTITSNDGRFAWTGVPRGRLQIGAFHPERGQTSVPATLEAGASVDVALALQ